MQNLFFLFFIIVYAQDLYAQSPNEREFEANVSFEELLEYALLNAPIMLENHSRMRLAEAEMIGAQLPFQSNPSVEFGVGGREQNADLGLDLSFGISQEIEIHRQQQSRMEAAEEGQNVAIVSLEEANWILENELWEAFIAFSLAQEEIQQLTRELELTQEHLQISNQQLAAGDISPLLILLAQAEFGRAQSVLLEAELKLAQTLLSLQMLSAWPIPLENVFGSLPSIQSIENENALLEIAFNNHPTLRVFQAQLEQKQAQLALLLRETRINPTIGFSYEREAGSLFDSETQSIMATVSFPLALWQNNQQPIAQLEAELENLTAQRDTFAHSLESRIRAVILAINNSSERIHIFDSSILPDLDQNLALLERAYSLGEITIHQVTQTREQLLIVASQHRSIRADYYSAYMELLHLLNTRNIR